MNWEPVIGLEIHVQLATNSKIFSGASTAFGAPPNAQACVIDLGLPGVLPVLNEEAVAMAIKFGLAIGAQINLNSIFDRKNYFYPDLPKGYQISQFETPVVGQGQILLDMEDGTTRKIGITRAHLEEDAGKSIHDLFPGQTGIDLNRTGTPLLEIVSESDLRTAAEAATYFKQIQTLVRCLKICDGNLAQGSMRCDANVSVRPSGNSQLGQRTEIKNINSFRFVERAINFEIQRHIEILESGADIERETRLYDPERDETRAMRGKEMSEDYRYFPDPDLLPLKISQSFVDQLAKELPELPQARRLRYESELNLNPQDAAWLSEDADIAQYFDQVVMASSNAKLSANWVMGELSAHLNKDDIEIHSSPVTPEQLGTLIQRLEDQTLSSKTAKALFEALWSQAGQIDDLIETMGLRQLNDHDALAGIIEQIMNDNPAQLEQLRNGKDKLMGFFVGQVMQKTKGKANPQQVNALIRSKL